MAGMASTETDAITISTALDRLEHLNPDEYIIALGIDDRHFYGTPHGYSAVKLPAQVLADVSAGSVKKIVWASFGSAPESWFFAYEMTETTYTFRLGIGVPSLLRELITHFSRSKIHLASLRVQLGDGDAFVVWTRAIWACSFVSQDLQSKLCQLSSTARPWGSAMLGSLKQGMIDNVQWHRDGSFYIKSGVRHMGRWEEKTMRAAWNEMWKVGPDANVTIKLRNELAYVTIDPHAPDGDSFAFLKKQQPGREALFIIHFSQDRIHSNLTTNVKSPSKTSLQLVAQESDKRVYFQWATCRKSGRPHSKEPWELKVEKDERVKILRDMGRDWFLAVDRQNKKGYVHGSWLDFGNRKLHTDPKSAYTRFQEDIEKMLVPGQLVNFPVMTSYIDSCTMTECQLLKGDASSLGICLHDVQLLLQGSSNYSKEWLKENRNVWHPDWFARFCHAKHAERLKPMAQQMFVFYGMLMEMA